MQQFRRFALLTSTLCLASVLAVSSAFAVCGDGLPDPGELCDDGNLVDDDGCDSNCTPTGCGNGIVTSGETCDDGNVANGDGCDANCTPTGCGNGIVTAGEVCDDGNVADDDGCDSNCTVTACGNGVAAGSEGCDDGNLVDGDGCDSNCTATTCGNGIVTAGEACDDGNVVSGDGCDANCALTGCGNGAITAGEACDDGNVVSGDGCDANCTVTACGNGILTLGEVCDDGNVLPGDGCRANCTVETCGDGITDAPLEACDDSNLVDGDGCDGNCTLTACGNGITSGAEQCDDGNVVDGDGCSQQCQQEILSPAPSAGDHFGKSLAAVAGNVVVGAPLYDAPGAINTGVVHMVHGTTGVVIRTFSNPTPAPGDEFGLAVAAFGTNILVGAPFDDSAGPNAGAVYLFNGGTGALIRTFLNPSPGLNDHFGASVGIVNGNVVVGAPKDDGGVNGGGVAYILHPGTGAVIHVLLNPQPAPDMRFGTTITSVGNRVAIGAPRYDKPAAGFDPAATDTGIVFVFDGISGAFERTINNPTPASGDLFGASLAPAGANLLIGAPVIDTGTAQSGAAYLVSLANGLILATYTNPVPTVNDEFGYSVAALGIDKVVIGSRRDDTDTLVQNAGSAFVFHAGTGALLQTIQKGTPVTNDEFGSAIATVGSRIFVGAPLDDTAHQDAGAVYSFNDASCGNGTLDPGEGCDDGNLINGDTCDANCTATGCGNGVVTAPEACDDGNTLAGDGCSPTCTVEGACGDGVLEPFEGCDDGNTVNGDGCDANCTPTGCGNGIQTAGEQCDLGPLNGAGFCCAANCTAFDQDNDGTCDQDDVCPTIPDGQANGDGDVFGDACDVCPGDVDNDSDGDGFCRGTLFNPPAVGGSDPCSRTGAAGTLTKPFAFIGRILAPLGDEKFRVRGEFSAGSNLPAMAPDRHGVQIRLADKHRTLLIDEHIPGGAYSPATGRGWKVAAGRKWTYADKGKPPLQNGLRQVVIIVKNPEAPNPQVFVSVAGFSGNYPLIGEDQFPIRFTVEVNDTALPAGGTPGRDQCGQIQFGIQPDRPGCLIRGSKIKCK